MNKDRRTVLYIVLAVIALMTVMVTKSLIPLMAMIVLSFAFEMIAGANTKE